MSRALASSPFNNQPPLLRSCRQTAAVACSAVRLCGKKRGGNIRAGFLYSEGSAGLGRVRWG